MGKKIFISICGIFIAGGVLLCLVGKVMGGELGTFYVTGGQAQYISKNNTIPLGKLPGNWNFDPTSLDVPKPPKAPKPPKSPTTTTGSAVTNGIPTNTESIRKIDIQLSAGDVIIQTGDTPSLIVDGRLEATSQFDANDGKWKIKAVKNNLIFKNNLFWWNNEDWTTTYTITIPQTFVDLDISIDMGTLTLPDITVQEAEIHTNMGTITAGNLHATEADISTEMGTITVTGLSAQECSLNAEMGSIDVVGNITQKLEADCSMGNVSVTLPADTSYRWEVESGMGSVSIDGQEYSGIKTKSQGGSSNALLLDLEASMGSIDISFA